MSYPPFANCGFELCDLPGQCQYEGKCHHPAKHSKDEITLSITEYEQLKNIKLHRYVNAANISADDMPHTVVEKLQSAIDEAIAKDSQNGRNIPG